MLPASVHYLLALFCRAATRWVVCVAASYVALDALEARGAELPTPRIRFPVEYSIRHWSGKDRLPMRSVEAILQTRDGFLWFGMNNGLGRFDGAQFQVFEPRNAPELGVSYITSLAEDRDGSLWIGSGGGGLARYYQGRFERFSAADGLSNEQVKALHVARDGRLWIGTDGGGAFVRDPATGVFRHFGAENGLAEQFVFGITEDGDGRLFLATYKQGPWRLSGDRFEPVPLVPPHTRGAGFALTRSPGGRVWLGTPSGVYRLETNVFHRWMPGTRIPGHEPVVAWEFENDNVWLGTAQGLVHWRGGDWTAYPIGGGSSGRFASAFIRDREGSIWKSSEGAGVIQLRQSKFSVFGTAEGLADDVVTSVHASRAGPIWVGTSKGLHRIDGGQIATFTRDQGVPDPFIFSIAEDVAGVTWIATRLGGLAVFETNRFVRLPKEEQPSARGAWCMTPTRDGSVWVGTSYGAFQYRDYRRVTHLRGEGWLSNDDVRAIAEDRDGNLWFGTSYGLNRYRDGRTTSYTTMSNSPPIEVTVSLLPDPDGSLWIGTMTRGLFLHRHGRFHHFGATNGLPADGIMSISVDRHRRLWLGTTRGIFRVPISSLDAVANGSSPTLEITEYGKRDGLIGEECSGTIQPTASIDLDGRLWIATSDGLATIAPSAIPRNETPPLARIERIALEGAESVASLVARSVGDHTLPASSIHPTSSDFGDVPAPAARKRTVFQTSGLDSIWIPPGLDRIEFQYSGLSFVTPEAVGFLYRLENYDSDWVHAGFRRVAYYTRVPPGRYTFQVRAINEDNVVSEPTTLAVFVAPAWWQTPWLRLAAALTAAGLLLLLFQARFRALQRKQRSASELSRHLIRSQEKERSRLAGELHDGIGQELQLIRNRSELSLQRLNPSDDLGRELHAISETAARAIHGVRALSRGLRPPELDQLGLAQALRWLGTNTAEAAKCRLDARVENIDGSLPAELELDFYRIAQEALNNATKHGQAAEITLEAIRHPTGLSLSVFDNGRGFLPNSISDSPDSGSGSGSGLKTMRERAAMLGGQLEIHSESGVGTRISLEVPLDSRPASRRP